MSIELTRCPNCRLFVSLRGYDYHIMRCGDRLQTREQMLRTLDAQNPAAVIGEKREAE